MEDEFSFLGILLPIRWRRGFIQQTNLLTLHHIYFKCPLAPFSHPCKQGYGMFGVCPRNDLIFGLTWPEFAEKDLLFSISVCITKKEGMGVKMQCLSCEREINLDHSVFDDYRGSVKCFSCKAMMYVQTEKGALDSATLLETGLEPPSRRAFEQYLGNVQ